MNISLPSPLRKQLDVKVNRLGSFVDSIAGSSTAGARFLDDFDGRRAAKAFSLRRQRAASVGGAQACR